MDTTHSLDVALAPAQKMTAAGPSLAIHLHTYIDDSGPVAVKSSECIVHPLADCARIKIDVRIETSSDDGIRASAARDIS